MANTSNNILQSLYKLATEKVEKTIEQIAIAQKVVTEAEEKHQTLIQYKEGYLENLAQLHETGLAKELHINYRHFLQKLDQAIKGQSEVLVNAKYHLGEARNLMLEAQRKKMSYEVLLKRNKKKEEAIILKKEQKQMDEFALRSTRKQSY
jgi:flagellar FliJ protein